LERREEIERERGGIGKEWIRGTGGMEKRGKDYQRKRKNGRRQSRIWKYSIRSGR
jgi:hypothetical protein